MSNLSFSQALEHIKTGIRMQRTGWNGKNMFVFLVNGSEFTVSLPPLLGIYPEGTIIKYNAHIDIKNVDGSISTWNPCIADILSSDWQTATTN